VVIAIDGPAGAGKSTVARAVARELGFTYLDTGAMYRAVALAGEGAIAILGIEFRGDRVLLDGEDVTEAIRTPEAAQAASRAATDPRVREAMMRAGTASVLVNDLHSVAKDAADEKPVCNMVLQIAADRGCPVEEAVEATVELHNRIVHEFEDGHRDLLAVPSPELQRFLVGVRSWMGGGFTWHATNPRYR